MLYRNKNVFNEKLTVRVLIGLCNLYKIIISEMA